MERTGEPYAAAYRLLSQLRTVARRLTSGLDATTLADSLLRDLCVAAPADRAAVLVRGAADDMLQLAAVGPDGVGTSVSWDVDLSADTALAEAWLTQTPQVRGGQHMVPGEAVRAGSALALPLHVGARTFGLAALESRRVAAYPPPVVAAADAVAAEAALPLETALLFEEVRAVATAEERRRVAREIHDGVAQELAALGYALDGLVADAEQAHPRLPETLRSVRGQLSGVLRDVRLSITALRTIVDDDGLAAALADYARVVGTTARFRVHLILDETPSRLPPATEGELLRIAQEAITNARKHAHADNLWVTCLIDPPSALLRIEDDGMGLSGRPRRDSYGLDIMRERALRLGASLSVRERQPAGTLVEVSIGRTSGRLDAAKESSGAIRRESHGRGGTDRHPAGR